MGGLPTTGRLGVLRRTARISRGVCRGFTIVEVMIVLAISGALFVSAVLLINGKQNQAGFNQAIQQIQSQIQQVMNDVSTGYFPNAANFKCTAAAGGPVSLTTAGPAGQGENAGCVFSGKVLQVDVNATDPEKYAVFTLAGAQKNSAGKEVTSISEAVPKVVAPDLSSPPGFPDITTTNILQNGLTTSASPPAGMWYNNGGGDVNIGAVAFVPSFASYGSTGINSGSQQLSVIAIPGTAVDATRASTATAINTNIATGIVNPTNGVFICYASGGTNQSGLVTIGGGGHPLAVTLKVMQSTRTCGR